MSKIYRYGVPVGADWQPIELTGRITMVNSRANGIVEVWAVHNDDQPATTRWFRAVGTGHSILGAKIEWVGSTIDPDGYHVWHLAELLDPTAIAATP